MNRSRWAWVRLALHQQEVGDRSEAEGSFQQALRYETWFYYYYYYSNVLIKLLESILKMDMCGSLSPNLTAVVANS